MEKMIDKLLELVSSTASKIVAALVTYVIVSHIIKWALKLLKKSRWFNSLDQTVRTFLYNAIKVSLYTLLAVSMIGIIGVPMASIVAALTSALVAIGMGLQGALSNLAGGMMLLVFRPFKINDYISANNGEEGTVIEINAFYTVLRTNDYSHITIPNGTMMNATIKNFTKENLRRVDLVFSCSKEEDPNTVQALLLQNMRKHPLILNDPAPFANVSGGTKESTEYIVKAWVNTKDYWTVYYDLLESVTAGLREAGIKAPAIRIVTNDK